MKRFEEAKKKRIGELRAVMSFITDKVCIKMHKGLFQREKSLEYFRGVNYHVAVLSNKKKILSMIPTFIEDGLVTKLDTMEDSIALGN